MMTSPILEFVDFTKPQKSRYLKNGTLFFLQIKNSLTTHPGDIAVDILKECLGDYLT